MSEERQFQAKLIISQNRWWAFRQRTAYQPISYGMRYLFTGIGVSFSVLTLMRYMISVEWWNVYGIYVMIMFLAAISITSFFGMRREEKQRQQLRMQAFRDFAKEYPWEFTYNLL